MLPADTVKLLQETAVAAALPRAVEVVDPRNRHFLNADGELIAVPVPPAPCKPSVYTMSTLAALAEDVTAGQVWVGWCSIVLVFDGRDRRDFASMPMKESTQFEALQNLADIGPMTQRELIRFLRLKLGVENRDLLDRFRRLDWTATSKTKSTATHARDSLGKEIMAEVEGVEEIPDTIHVTVPVFLLPECPAPATIQLALEIDTQEQRFLLVPMPGQIERAQTDAHDLLFSVMASLVDVKQTPIYSGAP